MATSKGKLEVFELIAEDETTESYLARWRGDTWIVLRRGRSDAATAALEDVRSMAVAIDDAHVVRTFDAGAELPVLLEEYVQGDRLETWLVTLEQKPLPWRVAAAIVRDAAIGAFAIQSACGKNALAASELWPGRLVVGFDGSVKIVDPCAELRGALPPPATRTRYGAPELADSQPGPAAAVYALGRILAELRAPDGATGDLEPPKAFERILLRATAEAPSERYRNASELAAALDALLDDPQPVEAYFAERFAAERLAHASALDALGDGTQTLETSSIGGEDSGETGGETQSGFTDEVKTAVMQRSEPRLPPDAAATSQKLPDFEESGDTEELRLEDLGGLGSDDDLLGSFTADADEDIRTRPFRRELIAKLKRTERIVLERGGARVAVVPTPVQPARSQSLTPDENVIVATPSAVNIADDDLTPLMPPVSSEHEEAPMIDTATVDAALAAAAHTPKPKPRTFDEPPPNSGETVMMRAIDVTPRSRTRDFVILAIATLVVAAVAFWVFSLRA